MLPSPARGIAGPRLHDVIDRASTLAEPYLPHLVGIVGVLIAFYFSSRSSQREQALYEARLRQFSANMSDYGLGSSGTAAAAPGSAASGPGPGDRREQRAKDDHGEVEVQWGREK